MRKVLKTLWVATWALTLPCMAMAASSLPEPLVHFTFENEDLTNTGTLTLQASPSVAEGFTFGELTDANGTERKTLKSTGNAVTNVDLAAEKISVSGSTVSFWTTTSTNNWRDSVGVDFLLDPAESTRTWQVWERMGEAGKMAVYGVTGPSDVAIGNTEMLHHWAMVGDASGFTFYCDGRYLGHYDKSSQLQEGSLLAAFGFGGSATRNAQMGEASVADVRIYGSPLSYAQVAQLASGETLKCCSADVEGEVRFSALSWEEAGDTEGETVLAEIRLADGATLIVDRAVQLDRLHIVVPEGKATVRLEAEGPLASVRMVEVVGDVDLTSAAIPSLTIYDGAVVTVESYGQIETLVQGSGGILRLAGGAPLETLSVDDAVAAGRTLAVAKEATTETLPISGRTLNIEEGADITVTTMFRTAHGSQSGTSTVNHTGGTLTCTGPSNSGYKEGAFVLSHWDRTTNYSLSGGTLNVTKSAAKLGADGTGNLTISNSGVANLHSVSLKSGTLTVGTGGTLNLGAETVSSATGVIARNGGALTLAGGTLGTWTRTDLSIAGDVTVSADSVIRTTSAEETPRPATIAFTGTLSGNGGLTVEGNGILDLSQATLTEGLGPLTLKGHLRFGEKRFPGISLRVEDAQVLLSITLTEEERQKQRVELCKAEAIPEGLTIETEGRPTEGWKLLVENEMLCYAAPTSSNWTWESAGSGSAWSEGFPDFCGGDNVTFGPNESEESVTLDKSVWVGELMLSEGGAYLLEGEATLVADTATIGGTLALGTDVTFVAGELLISGVLGVRV